MSDDPIANFLAETGTDGDKNPDNSSSKAEKKEESGIVLLAGALSQSDKKTDVGIQLDKPHVLPGVEDATKAFSSSSSAFFFLVTKKRELLACGSNSSGQLGLGSVVPQWLPTKVPIDVISPKLVVKKISTGQKHSLLLSEEGKIYSAGSNMAGAAVGGQLGLAGNPQEVSSFTRIEGLSDVIDIAAGHWFSLAVSARGDAYSWGHPEFGCLGHGTDGAYIREGGKGAKEVFDPVMTPQKITRAVKKDFKTQRVTEEYTSLKWRSCAAGRNHSVLVEDWEGGRGFNRIFTFGTGAYGRLGHSVTADEHTPRELLVFSDYGREGDELAMPVRTRAVRKIVAGAMVTLAIVESGGLYHWGKMQNAARGEATMYPTFMTDMSSMAVDPERVCVGSSCIVGFTDCAVAWGVNKLGYENGVKTSITPKYLVEEITNVLSVASGEGPQIMVTDSKKENFPVFDPAEHGQVGTGEVPPAKKAKTK